MSVQYLLDLFETDPLQGNIKEVVIPIPGTPTIINGRYVVRVPDDVTIPDTVTSPNDLIIQKYAGILANGGLFTTIVYDDMHDPFGIDLANSTGISTGNRGSCALYPVGFLIPTPTMQMNVVSLGFTPPSQAMVRYELFKYDAWDDKTLRYRRTYEELLPGANESCDVSFNNGATWMAVNENTLINIPVIDQGVQFIIRFRRSSLGTTNPRIYLGSWTLLY